jgi:hypothetical protein
MPTLYVSKKMKTIATITTLLILSAVHALSNPMLGEWRQDVDATIEQWYKTGQFRDSSEEKNKERERILRTKLYTPNIEYAITPSSITIVAGNTKKETKYTVEKQSKEWVLFSVQVDEGKRYVLWRFMNSNLVHGTSNETGNLEGLMKEEIIDVYVRK